MTLFVLFCVVTFVALRFLDGSMHPKEWQNMDESEWLNYYGGVEEGEEK